MSKPLQSDIRERLAPYVEGWRHRWHREADEATVRRRRVRMYLPEIIDLLVNRYGVSKIVLFGSFARDEATLGSDIDILVEGLPMEFVIDAAIAVERILRDVTVDLVPAEHVYPEILARAEAEGIMLYGR